MGGVSLFQDSSMPDTLLTNASSARCTSATVPIFTAFKARNGQLFRDRGTKIDDAIKLALTEASLLWPESRQLDILVSVGTGCVGQPSELPVSFESESVWREHEATIDETEKHRYHRFNLWQPHGTLPGLGAVSEIDTLEIATGEAFHQGSNSRMELRDTADALVASLFYMRIDSITRTSERGFHIIGIVACRLEQKNHARLMTKLLVRNGHFRVNGRVNGITLGLADMVRRGNDFAMPIDYTVSSLAEKVPLYLIQDPEPHSRNPNAVCHHISGSPQSLEKVCDIRRLQIWLLKDCTY
jgi:hypothetical protein